MTLHRHKLGKADKPTCTEADINTARNTLRHYNNTQRIRSLQDHPKPRIAYERGN